MIKLLLLVGIELVFNFNLQAKEVKGKIIFENDTVDVTFNIPFKVVGNQPDFERLQKRVKYYDASGKKKVLKPSQAIEIRFNDGSQLIRLLSRAYKEPGLATNKRPLFLKLEVDGEVKMFTYYDSRPFSTGVHNTPTGRVRGGGIHKTKTELIQKEDTELKRPKELRFRNDMLAFFNDCPELSQKIENRDFRKTDLASIIRFYNAICGE
jgi:hypothetical protein